LAAHKLCQVILFPFHAQSVVEVLRVDSPNAQVGHIAHGAHGHSHVKTSDRRAGRCPIQCLNSIVPARRIIVFRVEPFCARISKKLNERKCYRCRLRSHHPGRSEPGRLVELLEPAAIVHKIRPAHAFHLSARDQVLNIDLLPDAGACKARRKKCDSPCDTHPITSNLHFFALFLITSLSPTLDRFNVLEKALGENCQNWQVRARI
jgi:hypothetical protein